MARISASAWILPIFCADLDAVPGDFWPAVYDKPPEGRVSQAVLTAMADVAIRLQSSCICRSSLAVTEILHAHEPPLHGRALSKSLIADARSKMPDITLLKSDIIVGFPGETDEDFEQTLKLVQRYPV